MISSISSNRQKQNPCFGRALSAKELKHFGEIYSQGQRALNQSLGIQKDSKIFIMPDFSMPDIDSENTGMGRLFSEETQKFVRFIKNYFQADALQVLPQNTNRRVMSGNYFSPYSCAGAALGEHTISLKALTKKAYGEIITKQEFDEFAAKNKRKNVVNVENEIGIEHDINPRLELLKKAFERFKTNNTPELRQLQQEFDAYKKDPIEAKRMERIALYDILGHEHPDLFSETFDLAKREAIIATAQKAQADKIDFFKFCQFLADNHHFKSKEILNKEGLELVGDCPFGFSDAEKWSNPDAFRKETKWGLPWLNYNRMFKIDDTLDIAGKQFEEKLKFFFKRYNRIRFDVARDFAESQEAVNPKNPEKVLKFIEQTAKEFYGKDFDENKVGYEIFGSDLYNNEELKNIFQKRLKIITQNSPSSLKTNGYFLEYCQVGIGNHDIESAIEQFKYQQPCSLNGEIGAETFGIKDNKDIIKFHFGEFFNAPNKFIFFTDFFGREERFNYADATPPNPSSFRQKLPQNYEEEYHQALQKGNGFNLMESLAIAMKMQGLDKSENSLYEEVLTQGKILRETGSTTQEAADKIQKNTDKKDKKKVFQKISIAIVAISAIIASAILIKKKKEKEK